MMPRRLLFYSVLIFPAAMMLAIFAGIVIDLHEIHLIRPDDIYSSLKARLDKKRPMSFPLPEKLLAPPASKQKVFVFGSSDLLLSDGGVFPDYLEENYAHLHVVNLGIIGIDSFGVRQRVMEALSIDRPDILILYMGHNDFNYAYHGFVLPNYYEKFDFLLRIPYLFYNENRPVSIFSTGDYYQYARLHRPKLYKFFESLGLVAINPQDYEAVNRLILFNFMQNCEVIIEMAASRRVPVIIITPICNLRAEPFGDYRTTTLWYRQGMASADYRQSLEYLRKARDTEIFTYDMRAKTSLISYLKSLHRPGVYVMDLEGILERRHFEFGYADFLDYVHLNDRTHSLLAGIIYDFMRQNKLVITDPSRSRRRPDNNS